MTFVVVGSRVDVPRGLHLRMRQAGCGVLVCFALDYAGIEAAGQRVTDQPVLESVGGVTGLERCPMQNRQLIRGKKWQPPSAPVFFNAFHP